MTFLSPGTFRMDTVMPESTPAEAVQKQQQKDATRLVERLEQVSVPDLTVSYTLEKSATVLTRPPRAFRCRGRLVPAGDGTRGLAMRSGKAWRWLAFRSAWPSS